MSQLPGMKKATTFSNLEVDTTFGESMQHLNSKAENPKSYQWNFEQIQSHGEFSRDFDGETYHYQQDFSINMTPKDSLDLEETFFSPERSTIVFRCSSEDIRDINKKEKHFILMPPTTEVEDSYFTMNVSSGGTIGLNSPANYVGIGSSRIHVIYVNQKQEIDQRTSIYSDWIKSNNKPVCVQEDFIIYLKLQGIDTEMGGIHYTDDESILYYYTTNKVEQLQVQSCSTSWKKNTVFQVSGTTKKLYLTIFGSGSGSMEIIQKTIIVPSSVIRITSINLQRSTLDISGCQNLRSEYFSHVTVSWSSEENVIRMTQNQVDYFQRLSSPRITTEGSDYIFDGVVRVEVVENE